ncbi:MAG: hypothetical protein HC849_18210 [Oscillatoriales cyanobacterium RU_3_3]|nr:hypothetical protein [Oscillatoriales cyanobacterium RU_3_3]
MTVDRKAYNTKRRFALCYNWLLRNCHSKSKKAIGSIADFAPMPETGFSDNNSSYKPIFIAQKPGFSMLVENGAKSQFDRTFYKKYQIDSCLIKIRST